MKRGDVASLVLTCLAAMGFGSKPAKATEAGPVAVSLDPAFTNIINWEEAERVELLLSGFDFTPRQLLFRAGVPYRLIVSNYSRRGFEVISPDFFRRILVPSPVGGPPVPARFKKIDVRGGEKAEFSFIMQRPGVYKLLCTHFGHSVLGMHGLIIVTK
jgi:hypothetical protein